MNAIERDTYADWVLRCLGLWDSGNYLDKMEKDFDVRLEIWDDDTIEDIGKLIKEQGKQCRLGDWYASSIFETVIEKAVDELNAHESDFDYIAHGLYETELKCKGRVVKTWDDIKKIYIK